MQNPSVYALWPQGWEALGGGGGQGARSPRVPCPVKCSGLCQNRRGGGEVFWEDLSPLSQGWLSWGTGPSCSHRLGLVCANSCKPASRLGGCAAGPLRRLQDRGPWGQALCSLHSSPGFVGAAATYHSLGSADDRNVSSQDSVNERLEVRCGQASSS